MSENNEKILKRTEIEDNEAGQVTGGVGIEYLGDLSNLIVKIEFVDSTCSPVRCSKCGTEGHTAENCPNFSDS